MRGPLLRLLAAAITAWVLAGLALAALPDRLDVRTDIVGYPTFANFDVTRHFRVYGLPVVMVPLVATATYLLLARAFARGRTARGTIPRPVEQVEVVPPAVGWRLLGVHASRALLVALVLAFEVSVSVGNGRLAFVLTLLGYGLLLSVAAAIVARWSGRELLETVGMLNLFTASSVVAALYGVSRATTVEVSATGVRHGYPWLPLWLAAGATGALLVVAAIAWRRCPDTEARGALERRGLLLVVAPVGLFVFLASIPGSLGMFDFFEEGQFLAGSSLIRDGAFPWRDVLVAHGVLHDVFGGVVGTWIFEDSRWGVVAGQTMLLEPFAWIAVYYLCAYLFGSNWLYLLGSQALVITGWMTVAGSPTGQLSSAHVRFLLLPFVLLLLVALLRRATVQRAAAFMTLLALQVIVTPEALAAAVAYLGAIALFEITYYERGTGLRAGFKRIRYCLASGLVIAVAWALFLAANQALDDWIFSWTTLVSGHELTGGIPILVPSSEWFAMTAPVAVVVVSYTFVVIRTRLRQPLAFQDWAMVAMAAFSLVYYTKFLGREDVFHLDHSFYVTVPLLFYVAYRGITFGEAAVARVVRARGVTWFPLRHTLTIPLLAVLLLNAPFAPLDVARGVRTHFAAVATREPVSKRIGFDRPGENDYATIRHLSRAMDSLLGPHDTVFDFTNAPGLFHYVLGLPSATRYYHVSLAIRQRTQGDLVQFLESSKPRVVVFTSNGDGRSLPSWDGISNQVRHYDVSQYILDTYVPVLDSNGFLLMTPRREGVRVGRSLYFRVPPCDWGYVPNFFGPQPDPTAQARSLSFRPVTSGSSRRWTVSLPNDASAHAYRWLELRTGAPLREGEFVLADVPGAGPASTHSIAFRSLDRGRRTIRVPVGSCSQWHGYGPGSLQLTSSVTQDVREIRLVR